MWPRQNPRMHLKGLFREVIADIFNILGSVTAAGFTWFYNWIQYFLTNRPQTGWVLLPSHLPSPSHKAVQFSAHFKAKVDVGDVYCRVVNCIMFMIYDVICHNQRHSLNHTMRRIDLPLRSTITIILLFECKILLGCWRQLVVQLWRDLSSSCVSCTQKFLFKRFVSLAGFPSPSEMCKT